MSEVRELSRGYQKGLEFYDQGLYVDALTAFEAVLEQADPSSPEARLARFYVVESHASLAEDNLNRGCIERGEEHLRAAIARNPKYPDLHFQLAELLAEAGTIHEAIVELKVAIDINPDFAKALLMLGILEYETGSYDQGAQRIAHAVELEPRYYTPLYLDAMQAHSREDRRKALAQFREITRMNVDDISFHCAVGKKLYRAGQYDKATEAFEQALSLQNNYPDIRNWLGLSLSACGEHEKAFEQFQRALEINPNYTSAMINAGVACEMMELKDDARAFYERALEIDADSLEAKERLSNL